MFREWSIADGPAELTDQDVNIERTFTTNTGQQLQIILTTVGPMNIGAVHSFTGTINNGSSCKVFGTYNTRTRSGHCQALVTDA